jgi:hypothetical protein
MTKLLEQALREVEQLPEGEQGAAAGALLDFVKIGKAKNRAGSKTPGCMWLGCRNLPFIQKMLRTGLPSRPLCRRL